MTYREHHKLSIIIGSVVISLIVILAIACLIGIISSCAKTSSNPPNRFVTYNLDKTVCTDMILYGAYYIIDTETDVVYLRLVGGSNIGLTPLYNSDGSLMKATDLGITY